jgi:hypothetical protein
VARQTSVDLDAVNRGGQRIVCRVGVSPMHDPLGKTVGVVVTMEPVGPPTS